MEGREDGRRDRVLVIYWSNQKKGGGNFNLSGKSDASAAFPDDLIFSLLACMYATSPFRRETVVSAKLVKAWRTTSRW